MQQAQASRNAGGKPSRRRAAGADAASAGSATLSCVSCDTPKHSGGAPDCEPRPGRIARRPALAPMLAHVTSVRGAPRLAVSQILRRARRCSASASPCSARWAGSFPCNPGRPVFVSRSIGLDLGYCALGVLYAGVGPAAAALLDAVARRPLR